MNINIGKAVSLFVLALMMFSLVSTRVSVGPPSDVAYIKPTDIYVDVCEDFTVTVFANVSYQIFSFWFILNFDPTQMSVVEAEPVPPWPSTMPPQIGVDHVEVGSTYFSLGPGSIPLAEITFHCDAPGTSDLEFSHVMVEGPAIVFLPWQPAHVYQQWYFKPAYEDYAPSGVPDFDQRQDNWNNSAGAWTWCGPLSVANSLWWFDSKLEPNPVPPPTINDGFTLVTAYGPTDDHDLGNVEPFVNDLAWLMDTDGQRTGSTHNGTKVSDMEAAINNYLVTKGLDSMFVVRTIKAPPYDLVKDEVLISEDVVLLLGFWQQSGEQWIRVGGHFVTVAGVNPNNVGVAFSDPIKDNAEPPPQGTSGSGRVLPPPPHPHASTPPYPLHNDASYISHDFYSSKPSTSPGGVWGPDGYDVEGIIENFTSQNTPGEFEEMTGPYDPLSPVSVEVEYAVIVSPVRNVGVTNLVLGKTVVGQKYTMPIDVTVINRGPLTETFDVTTYYNATILSEGFESGTFADWDFSYSTDGAQDGSIPPGTWSSSIVSGASALSGMYSARLFADSYASIAPWHVDAAINRTTSISGAAHLKATFKFDQITDPEDGAGHAIFYISVINATDTSEFISYGFDNSPLLTPGDVSLNVSPGDLVNFEADIATDYFNKYGKALPDKVIIRFLATADYAEPVPGRQTIEVRLDDVAIFGPITPIETKTITLTGSESAIINFTWNTTGVPKDQCAIRAYAWLVTGETDVADNTYIDGTVTVVTPGDVNADGVVDIVDAAGVSAHWHPGPPIGPLDYEANFDINDDESINIQDAAIVSAYWTGPPKGPLAP